VVVVVVVVVEVPVVVDVEDDVFVDEGTYTATQSTITFPASVLEGVVPSVLVSVWRTQCM
jgi:hypothetical protein